VNFTQLTLPTVTRDRRNRTCPECPDGTDLDRALWAAGLLAHDTGVSVVIHKRDSDDWLRIKVGESTTLVPIYAAAVLIYGVCMGFTEERYRADEARRQRLRETFKATR